MNAQAKRRLSPDRPKWGHPVWPLHNSNATRSHPASYTNMMPLGSPTFFIKFTSGSCRVVEISTFTIGVLADRATCGPDRATSGNQYHDQLNKMLKLPTEWWKPWESIGIGIEWWYMKYGTMGGSIRWERLLAISACRSIDSAPAEGFLVRHCPAVI